MDEFRKNVAEVAAYLRALEEHARRILGDLTHEADSVERAQIAQVAGSASAAAAGLETSGLADPK